MCRREPSTTTTVVRNCCFFFKYIFTLFYYFFAETFILLVLVACIGLEWKYPEHQSQEKNVMLVNYRTLKKMTSFLFSSDETTIR